MILIVGFPGVWSSERLLAECRVRGVAAWLLDPALLSVHMGPQGVTLARPEGPLPLSDIQAVIVKKLGDMLQPLTRRRLNLLDAFEAAGVPVFNSVATLQTLLDRQRMTQQLAAASLPVPETLISESPEAVLDWVSTVGDVVLKPLYTSKARGMVRLNGANRGEWAQRILAMQRKSGLPFYAQRFVDSGGQDVGVSLVGGVVVGSYARQALPQQWNTTTLAGGRYVPFTLDGEMTALIRRIQRQLPADFTTVDLVRDVEGRLWVYELSPFGGFRGAESAGRVNLAGAIVDWVLRQTQPEPTETWAEARARQVRRSGQPIGAGEVR